MWLPVVSNPEQNSQWGWCQHPHHAGTCHARLCTTFKAPQSPGSKVLCKQRRSLLQWIYVPCPLKVLGFPQDPLCCAGTSVPAGRAAHTCPLAVPGTARVGCSACFSLPRLQFVCSLTVRLLVLIKLPVMKLPLVTSLQLLCWLKSGFRFATAPVLPGKV